MIGPWSPWSTCSRNGQTCGYKYGITTRTRGVLEGPSPNGASCPALSENRCCRMEMRHCAGKLSHRRINIFLIQDRFVANYLKVYVNRVRLLFSDFVKWNKFWLSLFDVNTTFLTNILLYTILVCNVIFHWYGLNVHLSWMNIFSLL